MNKGNYMEIRHFALIIFFTFAIAGIVMAQSDSELNDSAKDKYDAAKNALKKSADDLKEAEANLTAAIEAEKDNATANKEATFNASKKALTAFVNHMVRWLDVAEKRVEAIKQGRIDENDRATLISEIDASKSKLIIMNESVQSAQNRTELNDTRNQIKDEWNADRALVKKIVGMTLVARATVELEKVMNATSRVKDKIDGLYAKGVDTSSFDDAYSAFESNMSSAKLLVGDARAKFMSISSIQDMNKSFQDGMDLLKQAQSIAKGSLSSLRDSVKELKQTVKQGIQNRSRVGGKSNRTNSSAGNGICGGIAGFKCQEGYRCEYSKGNKPSYPDESGTCVRTE